MDDPYVQRAGRLAGLLQSKRNLQAQLDVATSASQRERLRLEISKVEIEYSKLADEHFTKPQLPILEDTSNLVVPDSPEIIALSLR